MPGGRGTKCCPWVIKLSGLDHPGSHHAGYVSAQTRWKLIRRHRPLPLRDNTACPSHRASKTSWSHLPMDVLPPSHCFSAIARPRTPGDGKAPNITWRTLYHPPSCASRRRRRSTARRTPSPGCQSLDDRGGITRRQRRHLQRSTTKAATPAVGLCRSGVLGR